MAEVVPEPVRVHPHPQLPATSYQPEVNPLNGAASASDLAFATGRGPDVVTDMESPAAAGTR
jgi:hypothetical protein